MHLAADPEDAQDFVGKSADGCAVAFDVQDLIELDREVLSHYQVHRVALETGVMSGALHQQGRCDSVYERGVERHEQRVDIDGAFDLTLAAQVDYDGHRTIFADPWPGAFLEGRPRR